MGCAPSLQIEDALALRPVGLVNAFGEIHIDLSLRAGIRRWQTLIMSSKDIGQGKVLAGRAEFIKTRRLDSSNQAAAILYKLANCLRLRVADAGGVGEDQNLVSRQVFLGSNSTH